ncbi:Fibroblast growth factor receptor-like 1 [Amphibalanus amphitrite]|uniref:receptor protein-tyrosine kinase n=2 Tax=Amphibalanus amphitrite TaxID=1232801 RepID=A0A6A4W1B4_AMPAM|nr:fibroblast growth factor receptor-like 1 isoform X1 [Amphibalanus amphitrite]KAF0299029.1 Fibroblast growth factor receptor-like 1 [Amphibalanus amphitrite]
MERPRHRSYRWAAVLCWLLAGAVLGTAQNIKGPPQINPDEVKEVVPANVGDSVKLLCPVSSGSHLMVDWYKDDEKVDGTWPGFRFGARYLRIKSVTVDQSGTYKCVGITGFGTVQHLMRLVVIDPSDKQYQIKGSSTAGNEYPSMTSRRFNMTPPKVTQVFPAKSPVRKMVGGDVRFKCVASGMPKPDVKWFKDGTELNVFRSGSEVDLSSPGQLRLRSITGEDSGLYECRVISPLGHASAKFVLNVEEPHEQKPEIVGDEPQNTTVNEGGQVSLQCRISGPPPMHVKWLKLLDPHAVPALRNASDASQLDSHEYRVMNVSDTITSSPDQYLIKLTLRHVRLSDAGQYVCLGANNGGFTLRPAYLTVRGAQTYQFPSQSNSHVYLMIIVPVAIVVVLALAAICCLCQRRKLSQLPDEVKSDAEAALMGNRIMSQLPGAKQRPELGTGSSETSRGVPIGCGVAAHHGRRYDPLPPHPTPTPSDHTYVMAPVGSYSLSSRRSEPSSASGHSSCSCAPAAPPATEPPRQLQAHFSRHRHKHLHYAC